MVQVCKNAVLAWFRELHSCERIDVLLELVNMCLPFELRFVGSCLEEIGKHTYQDLRGPTIIANDLDKLMKDISAFGASGGILDESVRHRILIYLSLLGSRNYRVANWLYRSVLRSEYLEELIRQGRPIHHPDTRNELLLAFVMALHHPAFTFEQKYFFGSMLSHMLVLKDEVGSTAARNVAEPSTLSYGYEDGVVQATTPFGTDDVTLQRSNPWPTVNRLIPTANQPPLNVRESVPWGQTHLACAASDSFSPQYAAAIPNANVAPNLVNEICSHTSLNPPPNVTPLLTVSPSLECCKPVQNNVKPPKINNAINQPSGVNASPSPVRSDDNNMPEMQAAPNERTSRRNRRNNHNDANAVVNRRPQILNMVATTSPMVLPSSGHPIAMINGHSKMPHATILSTTASSSNVKEHQQPSLSPSTSPSQSPSPPPILYQPPHIIPLPGRPPNLYLPLTFITDADIADPRTTPLKLNCDISAVPEIVPNASNSARRRHVHPPNICRHFPTDRPPIIQTDADAKWSQTSAGNQEIKPVNGIRCNKLSNTPNSTLAYNSNGTTMPATKSPNSVTNHNNHLRMPRTADVFLNERVQSLSLDNGLNEIAATAFCSAAASTPGSSSGSSSCCDSMCSMSHTPPDTPSGGCVAKTPHTNTVVVHNSLDHSPPPTYDYILTTAAPTNAPAASQPSTHSLPPGIHAATLFTPFAVNTYRTGPFAPHTHPLTQLTAFTHDLSQRSHVATPLVQSTGSPIYQSPHHPLPYSTLTLSTIYPSDSTATYTGHNGVPMPHPMMHLSVPPAVTSAAPPSCYNCGASGHLGQDCTAQTIDEITQKQTYILEYDTFCDDNDGDTVGTTGGGGIQESMPAPPPPPPPVPIATKINN